jgi:hypothetical protein
MGLNPANYNFITATHAEHVIFAEYVAPCSNALQRNSQAEKGRESYRTC